MMTLGGIKPKTYILIFKWIGWLLVATYVIAMFVVPLFQSRLNWTTLQDVWNRWQSLNAAMLAFVASIIAFNISRYNAEQERERNFIAARAFLPEAFSNLITYCNQSTTVFAEAWGRTMDPSDGCRTPLKTPIPALPNGYRSVFQECIKTASPEVGDRLAYILMKLQIHHTRLEGLTEEFHPNGRVDVASHNVISYLYGIAKIYALIDQQFEFARGESEFDVTALTSENYISAIKLAGTNIQYRTDFVKIKDYIERAIARENGWGGSA